MFGRLLRKYQAVVQVLVLTLGGVLAFSYTFFPLGSLVGLGLFSLGTALISTAFVSLLDSVFGTDVPSLIEQRLQFKRQVYDLGLENINLHIGDESVFRMFEKAHSIDLMYNTAKNTCYRYLDLIEKAIVGQKCNIRLLVSDPESPIWKIDDVCNGLCPGTNIPAEVEDVTKRVRMLGEEIKKRRPVAKGGSIEVRKYKCAPTGSIVIVDGQIARFTPYLPYAHSSEVPNYDVVKERGGVFFSQIQRTFDSVWERSEPIVRIEFSSRRN